MNKGLSHPGFSILTQNHPHPLLPTISSSSIWTVKGSPSNQVLLSTTVTQDLLVPCLMSTQYFYPFLNTALCYLAICVCFSNTSLIQQDSKNSSHLLGFSVTPLLGNSGGHVTWSFSSYLSQEMKRMWGWEPSEVRLPRAALWPLEREQGFWSRHGQQTFLCLLQLSQLGEVQMFPTLLASAGFLPPCLIQSPVNEARSLMRSWWVGPKNRRSGPSETTWLC